MASPRRLVVVSGLSGSGKSVVLHTLEDFGFYCIDNLPVGFLPEIARQIGNSDRAIYQQVAIGIDARNPAEDLSQFPALLQSAKSASLMPELVFVDADDEILLKRFSETRRKHPLSTDATGLARAIANERRLLEPMAEFADLRIDTSHMHIHQLRNLVRERVARRPLASLSLQFMSFGFKHGVPPESDFVFDVRCLPNPHWDALLRDQSGRDADVIDYLQRSPLVEEMVQNIGDFVARWVPRFEMENRVYLTVAVGCTGGRHRSVYVVERLAERFKTAGKSALVSHRDI